MRFKNNLILKVNLCLKVKLLSDNLFNGIRFNRPQCPGPSLSVFRPTCATGTFHTAPRTVPTPSAARTSGTLLLAHDALPTALPPPSRALSCSLMVAVCFNWPNSVRIRLAIALNGIGSFSVSQHLEWIWSKLGFQTGFSTRW